MPSPLAQWLKFPKGPGDDDEEDNLAQQMRQSQDMKLRGGLVQGPGVPSPAATQNVPTRTPGVQTVNVTAPRYQSDTDELVDRLKQGLDFKPQTGLPASAPQRPQLPQRPQQRPEDIIPQLFGAAGTIFSARSFNPHNYLGDIQGMQKAKRDEQYNDALSQVMNDYQGQREQYNDTLMRHQMELQEHERQMKDTQGVLQTLVEQRFLQGQMNPQEQRDAALREQYRQEFLKDKTVGELEEHARMLSATAPEGHRPIISSAAQNQRTALEGQPPGLLDFLGITRPGHAILGDRPESAKQPWNRGTAMDNPEYRAATEKGSAQAKQEALQDPEQMKTLLPMYRQKIGNPNATMDDLKNYLQQSGKKVKATEEEEGKKSLLRKRLEEQNPQNKPFPFEPPKMPWEPGYQPR